MATTAGNATAAEIHFQQVVRVATYAIEDLASLSETEWFTHDNQQRKHQIKRDGEEFTFRKSHYSRYKPTYIGYDLETPQSVVMYRPCHNTVYWL